MPPNTTFRTTLQLRDVSHRFQAGAGSARAEVDALRNASVEIRGGEVLIVAGPVGSGKTTLLLCAAGLLRCDTGEILGRARRVVYREMTQPARPIAPLIRGAVILLDSCDDLPALPRFRATRIVADAIAAGAGVVLAARDARDGLALTPPAVTVSILHLRLGEVSGRTDVVVARSRVAEAVSVAY